MVVEEWISLREFARRRDVALSAVQKAIESGRVTAVRRAEGGRITGIEFHQATEQWNRHTDPVQAARSGTILGTPIVAPAAALATAPAEQLELGARTEKGAGEKPDQADGERGDFYESRAKRERFAAAREELEYLEAIAVLVPAAEIRESASRRYRAIRDKLLNIPDRVASIVAAEKDPARVHAALSAEIKRVLHELSDDAAAELALGAEERVAA